ncbi:MAG TPA: LeuA family protein [Thermoanaerobaculia bacterium]|jgi:2-isopropylmalate synthase
MDRSRLVYDWNRAAGEGRPRHVPVELVDETLRDGLQSPSAVAPTVEQRFELVCLMERLGVDTAVLGIPAAGSTARAEGEALARLVTEARLSLQPGFAARTLPADIEPVVEIAQRVGRTLEMTTFIGSSPIRQYVEDWDLSQMMKLTRDAVTMGVREGLLVTYVTEDTTRARPEDLVALYGTAIQAGATRICACDTVGHATPEGTGALVGFLAEFVARENPAVRIDWHGHQDRGLAVANSLSALRAGAHRVHGCGLGLGERVGNTPMDQMLVNLRLLGWIDRDLSALAEYVQKVADYVHVPIPDGYPVVGRDAFRTGTGGHAAAIVKARAKGDDWLADRVYSGVPAGMFGLKQVIDVGPMSGESNVVAWMKERGLEAEPERVAAILRAAKLANHVLADAEIRAILGSFPEAGEPGGARDAKPAASVKS